MNGQNDSSLKLRDQEPQREQFLEEALQGLSAPRKQLPCKYFYDERGSQLFERICELPEYYPTRTELGIMRDAAPGMAQRIGPECMLVEYGSGNSLKTRTLLDCLDSPAAYVPVDISKEHLKQSAEALDSDYPGLEVLPVCADFTRDFELPQPARKPRRRAVYFPGSTIGNFTTERAVEILEGGAKLCGPGAGLLVGVDLKKDRETLERAYDDSEGVTAAFNRNVLVRMNRELNSNFDIERFRHRAVWREDEGRVEMHLVSEVEQVVRLNGESIRFEAGESICTEHSHKYTLPGFAELAERAGLAVRQIWTDESAHFSVQYLEAGN